jgi:hypothetical protein
MDRRAEELDSLRLALATFALQLNAFETRLKSRQTRINARSSSRPTSVPIKLIDHKDAAPLPSGVSAP